MKRVFITVLLSLGYISSANAVNLGTQPGFDTFSREVGAASLYRAVAPADPLGITGFDIAVEATMATIDGTSVTIPKLKFQKGLPGKFDIAGYYTALPTSGIAGVGADGTAYGVALSYAFMEGGMVKPALAIRGSYTTLDIPGVIGVNTTGVDLTISKGFVLLTPYAGAGLVNISSTDKTGTVSGYSGQASRYFVGANLNLKVMDVAFESGKTGDSQFTTVKLGFRF